MEKMYGYIYGRDDDEDYEEDYEPDRVYGCRRSKRTLHFYEEVNYLDDEDYRGDYND